MHVSPRSVRVPEPSSLDRNSASPRRSKPSILWRYGLLLIVLAALAGPSRPALGQAYTMEFSIDIGSDCELSDPNADGDEAFDPGDVYWWDGTLIPPPGRNGQKNDVRLFGFDPAPDPASGTVVPIRIGATPADYYEYFDGDGDGDLNDFVILKYNFGC